MNSSLIIALALVPMWVIALLRLPGIRRSPRHALIGVALVSACLNATIAPQPAFHEELLRVSNRPGLAFAVEMATGIIALSAVGCWLLLGRASLGQRPVRVLWPVWATAAALIATTSALALTHNLERLTTYDAVGGHRASAAQMLALGLYEGYLLAVYVFAAVSFALLGRAAASRLTRIGLYLMAIGNLGGTRSLYTLLYVVPDALRAWFPHIPPWPWPWSADLAAVINYPGYLIGFFGLALPALSLPLNWYRARRDLRLISPLWHALRTAYPRVIRVREDLPIGARLIAAVTEIHDAIGLLAAWPESATVLAKARAAAAAAGLPTERIEAAAHAAWIAVALVQRPDLATEHSMWGYGPDTPDDIAGGISWITAIAREYAHGQLPLGAGSVALPQRPA
ncbi:DUF6545 domain-containing protein [Nonomuraea turcica]|uniref:DUF6545 domain-containing protein n=1 Tax=Nonomuraea sp. G32 TaxID=3067274 RepID=UPI00273B0127|nr:DUF6545 domain-containing protein [Nonomuraea sp. G32]MDP4511825.1 hypothetical protein [Nonomuraea sp. G32]